MDTEHGTPDGADKFRADGEDEQKDVRLAPERADLTMITDSDLRSSAEWATGAFWTLAEKYRELARSQIELAGTEGRLDDLVAGEGGDEQRRLIEQCHRKADFYEQRAQEFERLLLNAWKKVAEAEKTGDATEELSAFKGVAKDAMVDAYLSMVSEYLGRNRQGGRIADSLKDMYESFSEVALRNAETRRQIRDVGEQIIQSVDAAERPEGETT